MTGVQTNAPTLAALIAHSEVSDWVVSTRFVDDNGSGRVAGGRRRFAARRPP